MVIREETNTNSDILKTSQKYYWYYFLQEKHVATASLTEGPSSIEKGLKNFRKQTPTKKAL